MTVEKKRTSISLYGQVLKMKNCLPEAVLDGNPYGDAIILLGTFQMSFMLDIISLLGD